MTTDFKDGRLFTEAEADASRSVCVLGYDVADALFPGRSALDQTVEVSSHRFRVIGVLARRARFSGFSASTTGCSSRSGRMRNSTAAAISVAIRSA